MTRISKFYSSSKCALKLVFFKKIKMKTFELKYSIHGQQLKLVQMLGLGIILLVAWYILPNLLSYLQPTVGLIDLGIWQLFLFAIICFALIWIGSWWVYNTIWTAATLPQFSQLVLQFNNLTLWQQYVFYWASFALFLLSAIACLAAVF